VDGVGEAMYAGGGSSHKPPLRLLMLRHSGCLFTPPLVPCFWRSSSFFCKCLKFC
jgi:hypothetical protein